MLIAVYYNNKDIRIQELSEPKIDSNEILLKVMACGICGSDVMEWYRLQTAPRVLGHEATGIIEKVGEDVLNYMVGDRVFVSHHVPCNRCHYCLVDHHTACETLHTTNYYPGGFSQYIKIPKINVQFGMYRLPSNISYEEGTFIEPLGCVVRGQNFLAPFHEDNSILIIGSGVSGILHLKLAKLRGSKNIFVADINPSRLEFAEKFGATYTLNSGKDLSQKLRELNGGRLADRVIVCTGATRAAITALECVDRGGIVLYFAVPDPTIKIPVPINHFWRSEVSIKSSYGAAPNDLIASLEILAQKKIKVTDMITHRLLLTNIVEGFRLVSEAKESLKVIIEPNRF